MGIAGALSAAGAALYNLAGNTEFFWSTYQSLPAIGFNGIPVALLALCNPIGVIFAAMFMSMLSIAGLQLSNLTAYNEYITDVIISVIVYLSAFSLFIRTILKNVGKKEQTVNANAEPVPAEPAKEPADGAGEAAALDESSNTEEGGKQA
jgi:simple sugar transport system permease protein